MNYNRAVAFLLFFALLIGCIPCSYVRATEGGQSIQSTNTTTEGGQSIQNTNTTTESQQSIQSTNTTTESQQSIQSMNTTTEDTGHVNNEKDIRNSETLTDMRGVWISFVDYKSMGLYGKSEKTFRNNAAKMFRKLKDDNINTVFFHVVPCNDAIYPSEYLKWSKYMFSKAPSYDPLSILIELAHENDISFHAWLNPYRKTMKKSFNPGKESSIDRILDIVNELVDNYEVDGIHMDDYFYPTNGQFKKVSVKKKKKNVNKMVRQVYETIKETDEEIAFGISPAGNISYAESIGCDLKTWLSSEGYIDYIIPQIYWSDNYMLNGKKTKLYSQRLKQWTALNENDTPMIIGLALYRAGMKDSNDKGWAKSNKIIVSQIKKEKAAGCQGFVLFSSKYMYNKSGRKEMNNYRKYYKIK